MIITHDPILDHRARLERDQFEATERRGRALVDQSSPNNSPAARVSAWERLHQLRLPSDPTHAILPHVAKQTALELEDILEVQRMRAHPVTAAV